MKKSYSKLGIITRTKNRPILLERSIKSLYSQTCKDFTHVIINDGGNSDVLNELLAKYPYENRVIIHNEKSEGPARTLNEGIKSIECDLISILDDDDTWAPERVEVVLDFFKNNPNSMACVVKMDIIEEEMINEKIHTTSQYLHPDSGDGEVNLYKQCFHNYVSNGIVTYRKEVFNILSGYDESLTTAEDWDFGIRLLMKYDVEYIQTDASLFFYHQRPKSADSNGNSVHAQVRNQEVTINKLRNHYLRKDFDSGKVGPGLIMNQIVSDIQNTVRLEGHINLVADENRRFIDQKIDRLLARIKKNPLKSMINRLRKS